MDFRQKLGSGIIVLDGAMGTCLQRAGLPVGVSPEEWNIARPEEVERVHREYLESGADVIYTNTFGANPLKFGDRTEELVSAAVSCARRAAKKYKDKFVALDVGPTGKLLKPLGPLGFEEAVTAFKRTIRAGVAAGVDLIAVETMNDLYELKAAILAAKEVCNLPVIATAVFGEDEKLMTGCTPEGVVALAEGMGVDAVGVNCSLSPAQMKGVAKRMLAVASIPVAVKPNAGLPQERDGAPVYSVTAEQFAAEMEELARAGVTVLGGCCGTTPAYIRRLSEIKAAVPFKKITEKGLTTVCSYTHALEFGKSPVLIGERINPTGKKRLKEALRSGDVNYVLGEAVRQEECGADALDVNVGLPEIDEPSMLERCITEIQAVTSLPLQIDTSDPVAMERAMRVYNGKPLVNSVNGKAEITDAVFPLVKKYGGVIICLTLDENGIPSTAEGRVAIAEKIIGRAEKFGISRTQLIFDTLATAVSADPQAAIASLGALKIIKEKLGCNTSLGISNISFGLPGRDFITSTYFALALANGLSAAICNVYSAELKKVYRSFMALTDRDAGCGEYIKFASALTPSAVVATNGQSERTDGGGSGLKYYVVKGLKSEAAAEAKRLLAEKSPLGIMNGEVIPALDEVGRGFENKSVFLPQLLMSAEAAGAAFDVLKAALGDAAPAKKTKIVLATVKGDIHDIGKNIVASLLVNYGFTVFDLGKDVDPERVVAEVKRTGAKIVGLSALMTTTVVNMRVTLEAVKAACPGVLVCVGGAVLTEEYARDMGADRYCKDAMDTVRYAEEVEARDK